MDDSVQMTGVLDPRSGWQATNCSIARALDVVNTRTAMLLLREAFYGTTRFDDFVTRVGASEPVTASRLRELVEAGLLAKEPYREPGQRTRHGYRLTDKGHDFLPVLVALMQWGERWESPTGRGVGFRHGGSCSAPVHAELRCEHGHHVGRGELELHAGPATSRRIRERARRAAAGD